MFAERKRYGNVFGIQSWNIGVIICRRGKGEALLRRGRKGFHPMLDGNYTRQV